MGLRFCTDLITDTGASGWVVGDSTRPLTVEAWCEGQLIGQTHPDRSRPEVAAGLGINSFGENTGFSISFEIPQVPRDLLIEIKCSSTTIGANCVLPKLARDKIARAQFQSNTPLSPFPRPIFAAIRKIWPNEIDDAEAVVRRIGVLASNPQCASLPFVADYARYVRLVWAHCQFVSKYFPANSDSGDPSAKDYNWKPNSPEEIMSIAHHLYVLKSYGISGAFAEFGCFKGFSSAMLSYACDLLGIKMHIFDSFKGLPASSSGYYRPGEFSGSLKEVRRNIEQFGSLRPVTFHKGFFDQSIPSANLRELMCLWMDVDLETSAKDVMKIARKLNKRGTIFSHECYPSNFNHGSIIATRSVNSVLPPVVDQFKKLGSELAGQFVFGNTGALWRKRVGCPVLPIGALKVLIGATEYEQAQRAITHLATERSALTASRDQAQGALKQLEAERSKKSCHSDH